jgi:hypothetical protein
MKPTHYLRFPSEDTWKEVATELGIATSTDILISDPDTGEIITPAIYETQWDWKYYTHDYSCDVVGIIYNSDGEYDADTGELITPPTPLPGFHVNYIGYLPEKFHQYLVVPTSPNRTFAQTE